MAPRGTSSSRKLRTVRDSQGVREPEGSEDAERVTRSFHISSATLARFQSAFAGTKARTYDTPIADDVPSSLSAAADEALNLWSGKYEDLLNEGREFPRTGRLSPGPSPAGARAGADKRAEARRRAKETTGDTQP